MAVVTEPSIAGAGPLSARARAQYRALAAMRWHAFRNGMRSKLGAFELGARTISFALYALLGLGLSAGLAASTYMIVSNSEWRFMPLPLWALFLLWQMIPVLLASFQEQFDLSILLRFPVNFGSYILLYLIFGLVDASTILGALCSLGLWLGVTVARPDLFAWAALALAVFALFNLLLARAIFAWIDRWLAQRRTREILGAVFLLLALSMQLLNPAFHQSWHRGENSSLEYEGYESSKARLTDRYGPLLETAERVQSWLPPGLAAQSLQRAGHAHPPKAIGNLGILALYAAVAGMILALRLKAEYRGENLGTAPSLSESATKASRAATSQRRATPWLLNRSGPIAAIMEKEVRTLIRSMPLLFALGTPLFMVVMWSTFLGRTHAEIGSSFPYALPLGMAYALLGFTQFIYNSFGGEGHGIQLYFLSPTPIRTVLLAKNFFHSLLFALDALLAGTLICLRLGVPSPAVLAASLAWVAFALPTQLAAGNVLSLTMPYRINPGRISRQRGSQASALLSLLIQLAMLAAGAAVFGLCWWLEQPWLPLPIFLLAAAASIWVWQRGLGNADAMANARRDSLITTLAKQS